MALCHVVGIVCTINLGIIIINNKKVREKILIVDDDLSIRLLLGNFLSRDYEVVTKANGLEAMEWLEENLPHLIVCDLQMPEMDGYQFLEKVRERGFTKHTPVVILSGSESSKDRVKCYQMGSQDFLVKPFNPEELGEIIHKNLFPIHYSIKW